MSRPPRRRGIDSDLVSGPYGPRGRPMPGADSLERTLDGLEAIGLVDLEGLDREAAAERMGVSRATLARVPSQARGAVAEAPVHRRQLVAGGGPLRRHDDDAWPCPVHGHPRRRGRGCRCEGKGRGPRRRETGRSHTPGSRA